MRGFQPQLAQQFAQKKKRANYAEGGPVRGPGTGTSDSIKDVVSEGTYIMPTDSTRAIGEEQLATMGQEQLPVNLSNGEFKLSPEQVHAIGVQALDQMKGATHTPAPEGMGNPAKGVKPELFFADGGVATTKKKKASDSPSDAGDASGGSGGADASAAPSSPPPSSVPGADGVMRQGNSYSAAPAVPAAPTAPAATGALPSALEAASPAVAQKPNYFPGNSPDAGAPIYNGVGTANGLGSSDKLATVPQGLAGGAQPPAPQIPQNMGNRAAANPPQTAAMPDLSAQIPGQNVQAPAFGASPAVRPDLSSQIPGQSVRAPAPDGSQDGVFNTEAGRNLQNTAMALPGVAGVGRIAQTGGAISRGISALAGGAQLAGGVAGVNAAQGAAQTGSTAPQQNASTNYNFPDSGAGAGRGNVNPPNAFPNAVVPSIAEQTAQNNAKPAAPQAAASAEPVPMLPRDEYRKMTNAQVMEANPNGAIKAVKDAKGQWSFSGGSVSGDVSYVGADGKPLAGGGLNGKGFKGIDIAPAGAHIAFGGGDNYAFSREAPAPTGERKWGATGNTMNGVAIPNGMRPEQAAQYSKEVLAAQSAAQTSARGAQIVSAMQGSKAMRDWNDLRSPEGIAKRNLEMAMSNYPPGQRGGKPTVQQQAAAEAYKNLAAGQFQKANNEGGVATDNQRYADGQRRANQQDANTERAYQDSRADAAPVREAREQENKARGISVRQAEKAEAARDGYFKALDSGDEKAAATSLEKLKALSGIDGKDSAKWKMHSGPSSKDENGIVTPGETYLYNESTGETRGVGGDSGALPPIGENPKVAAIMKNTKLSMDERKQQVRELGYK